MDYVEAAAERIELYEITTMTTDVRDLARCLSPRRAGPGRGPRPARPQGRRTARSSCASTSTGSRTRPTAILRRSVARLFKEEKDPITVIKWKEIYENLESASDRCEDVANIIEGVILEHADRRMVIVVAIVSRSRWCSTSSTASTTPPYIDDLK